MSEYLGDLIFLNSYKTNYNMYFWRYFEEIREVVIETIGEDNF